MRTTDGRVPGRRGQATRRRLLDSTAKLLSRTCYRDVTVIDIARETRTSPATFYQYFPDVEHAVLVLAEEQVSDAVEVAELVVGDWRGRNGARRAREVVEGFLDYYERHRAVLRVVDLATVEGDVRFQRLRTRAMSSLTEALADAVAAAQADGRGGAGVDPRAAAFVLVAMLTHCAAHRPELESAGVSTETVVDAMVPIVHFTVTGRRLPPGR